MTWIKSSIILILARRRCPTPGVPAGYGGATTHPNPVQYSNGGLADGYTVIFGCLYGRHYVGPTQSTCEDGTWSHRPGSCV